MIELKIGYLFEKEYINYENQNMKYFILEIIVLVYHL